jgi:hypothetical protein
MCYKIARNFLILLFTFGTVLAAEPLKLENAGTEKVYFSYHGKPLLSFGGLSDFIFYASEDAYDYKLWADWAAGHGMNHVRAYPPLSWKHVEKFTIENGGALENMLFPYQETSPGSRQFDLRRFDERYWRRFRQQCEYLQSKGIIIHLLMWNGWQLRAGDTPGRDRSDIDWAGHFFNPANNVNAFTDHLGPDLEDRFAIYHCVANKNAVLVKAQKAWFEKLVEVTGDLDNVYYDLVHEIGEHYRDWTKTQSWIQEMARAVRQHSRNMQSDQPVILGMDTGGLSEAQRGWIFSRRYFNLLIYGKRHTVANAQTWRTKYKKPYIPQESWDDNGQKYSYIHPEQRVHTRKYMWKFLMARCQQMDLYMKPRTGLPTDNLPKFPHHYNPNGRNPFENDALVLRVFWDGLTDYPNLWFNGSVESGPGSHRYVLCSEKEVVVYCSSATNKEGVFFASESLKLKNLRLSEGIYRTRIIKPDKGTFDEGSLTVRGGAASILLPEFVDDIVVHLYGEETMPAEREKIHFKIRRTE